MKWYLDFGHGGKIITTRENDKYYSLDYRSIQKQVYISIKNKNITGN